MSEIDLSRVVRLPVAQEYDAAIQTLHDQTESEGAPRFYLGRRRLERRNSREYFMDVLAPLTGQALALEPRYESNDLVNVDHKIANAALSGMLFGTYINELVFDDLESRHPYRYFPINPVILGDSQAAFEAASQKNSYEGFQLAARAMSRHILDNLSTSSLEALRNWSEDLIPANQYRPSFNLGFGMAIHSGRMSRATQIMNQAEVVTSGFSLDTKTSED